MCVMSKLKNWTETFSKILLPLEPYIVTEYEEHMRDEQAEPLEKASKR